MPPKAWNSGIFKTSVGGGTLRTGRGRSFFVWFLGSITILGAIGITCLAIWVDWTKWTISRLLPQLHHIPPEEAIELLQQLAPYSPASIPLLVQGLCDPRPAVAQAAQKELQNLQQQWENQAWHQVSQPLSCLAQTLAEQKERLPPHSRPIARQLAEWILAWRPPEGSPERVEMIAACGNLLVYLARSGGPSQQSSPTEPGRPPQQQGFSEEAPSGGTPVGMEPSVGRSPWRELVHPLEGFRLPGGGLPVGGPPEGLPTLSGSASDNPGPEAQWSASLRSSFPSAFPSSMLESSTPDSSTSESVLRIREPMEAGGFPPIAGAPTSPGSPETTGQPRLNQAVRLQQTGSAENSQQGAPGPPYTLPTPKAEQTGSWEGSEKVSPSAVGGSEPKPGQRPAGGFDGPDALPKKPEHLQQKEVSELLVLLVSAAGEEQKQVQRELARRGFGHVPRQLARQLTDPNPQVRLDLARRLPSMAGVEPTVWLFWLCRDPDAQVRSAAMGLLATTKDPAILEQLEKLLATQPDQPLRQQTQRLRTMNQTPVR